jgi:hypothetical protein
VSDPAIGRPADLARQFRQKPGPDVAALLHALLDRYERRGWPRAESRHHAIRVSLEELALPGYHSQTDPLPRQVTNEQLIQMEQAGLVELRWLPGEAGHLLDQVTLRPEQASHVFALLGRTSRASRQGRLRDLLLGERFRFSGWHRRAVQACLDKLAADQSPVPFSLDDHEFNRDLLAALFALDDVQDETPYRVFSVRVFNDSKRFEALLGAVALLARRAAPEWRGFSTAEVLRELNLVPNPGHLVLHGPWELAYEGGELSALAGFSPSVGVPAAQAARVRGVRVATAHVVCVENPTAFYELIRTSRDPLAAICLSGNPSPACRHLLRRLPAEVGLRVWADIDYGGLNILAQLREQVSSAAVPYRMDVETLEAHARWARPLGPGDARNLARLARRAALADLQPLIEHMLRRGLKLEQEAIRLP